MHCVVKNLCKCIYCATAAAAAAWSISVLTVRVGAGKTQVSVLQYWLSIGTLLIDTWGFTLLSEVIPGQLPCRLFDAAGNHSRWGGGEHSRPDVSRRLGTFLQLVECRCGHYCNNGTEELAGHVCWPSVTLAPPSAAPVNWLRQKKR